jgi:hypothetical protein
MGGVKGKVRRVDSVGSIADTTGLDGFSPPSAFSDSQQHLKCTVKTQIQEKCARTLEFPFLATRGENTANSAPS